MSLLESLLLGLAQGLTEFFPISSSGHLFLLEKLLNINHDSLSFAVILHGSSLLAIFTVFFRDLVSFRSSIVSKKQQKILLRVLISSIPLLFVGLFLKSLVSWSFKEPVVASGFFITGTLLLSLRFNKNTQTVDIENLSLAKAFIIGVFQSLAVLPGFSRSGWTISSCLFLGLGKKDSVYYSFLIAIPAIGGSLLIELVQNFANIEFSYYLLVAFLVSYLSGTLALFLILKLVQKQRFSIFAFYLIPLGFYLLLF